MFRTQGFWKPEMEWVSLPYQCVEFGRILFNHICDVIDLFSLLFLFSIGYSLNEIPQPPGILIPTYLNCMYSSHTCGGFRHSLHAFMRPAPPETVPKVLPPSAKAFISLRALHLCTVVLPGWCLQVFSLLKLVARIVMTVIGLVMESMLRFSWHVSRNQQVRTNSLTSKTLLFSHDSKYKAFISQNKKGHANIKKQKALVHPKFDYHRRIHVHFCKASELFSQNLSACYISPNLYSEIIIK